MMKTRPRQTYQHIILRIYMRHKYNSTAANEKIIILFLDLVNQKILSYSIRTLKKNATGTIINT